MPRKPSTHYPRDLDTKLEALIEGFEKHGADLIDTEITGEKLKSLRDDYVDARYKVTQLRTELGEAIEKRDALALGVYGDFQKTVSYLRYKFGVQGLVLEDFGVTPKRSRKRSSGGGGSEDGGGGS